MLLLKFVTWLCRTAMRIARRLLTKPTRGTVIRILAPCSALVH